MIRERLEPNERDPEDVAAPAQRVRVVRHNPDGSCQAVALGQPGVDDPEGTETIPEESLEALRHWGHHSRMPADTEALLCDCEAGDCLVGEAYELPEGIPAEGPGDSTDHGNAGEYVACRAGVVQAQGKDQQGLWRIDDDGNLLLQDETGGYHKIENGAQVLEPAGGEVVKIGAAAAKALGLDGDQVTAAAAETLSNYLGLMESYVSAVAAAAGYGGPVSMPIWSSTNRQVGKLVASATKGKGE